jgi:hypothetical protein
MTELSDVRATVLEEEIVEQRFSVPAAPTKTAATRRTSQRAKRAIEPSSLRSLQIGSKSDGVVVARRRKACPLAPPPSIGA